MEHMDSQTHKLTHTRTTGSQPQAIIVWTVNIAGLTQAGAQHDLLLRAEQQGVSLIFVQETMFTDSSAMSIGPWLRLNSGKTPGQKTVCVLIMTLFCLLKQS